MTKMAACEKIADKELNCCFCADHSEHYGGTAEQAAEKRLRDKSLPQRLKPSLIRNGFRDPEGPLFHGAARLHDGACIHDVARMPQFFRCL